MKKALYFTVLIVLGCARFKGPYKYIFKTSQSGQDSTGKKLTEKIQTDTITAINDTAAYAAVVKRVTGVLNADTINGTKITKVHTFEVTDWNGTPLQLKLSKKIIDSINNVYFMKN